MTMNTALSVTIQRGLLAAQSGMKKEKREAEERVLAPLKRPRDTTRVADKKFNFLLLSTTILQFNVFNTETTSKLF